MSAISRPKNANNAIEAALFVVVLAQPVDAATMQKVGVALDTVADKLPGTKQPMQQGLIIQFGGGMTPPFGDVMRFKSAPDGTHEWRVQVMGNLVQVACQTFSDFSDVWGTAEHYLRLVLGVIAPQMDVQEVGYQVVDKFEYEEGMRPMDYDMAELFQKGCPYLTPQSWKSGLRWHVYQGWFEQNDQAVKLLHQLNLSNTDISATQIGNIIDHRVAARASAEQVLTLGTLVGDGAEDRGSLDKIFRMFHKENLRVIRELLTPDKLLAIGMKVVA